VKYIIVILFFTNVWAAPASPPNPLNSVVEKAERFYQSQRESRDIFIARELYKLSFFFAASKFTSDHLQKDGAIDEDDANIMHSLLIKTGTHFLLKEHITLGKQHKSFSWIKGQKYLIQNKYTEAEAELKTLTENDYFYGEAQMSLGVLYSLLKKNNEAFQFYESCFNHSQKNKTAITHHKLVMYYDLLAQTCHLHMARILSMKGESKNAIKKYEEIKKTSYIWPQTILEKAWNYYNMQNYNQAIGMTVALKAPILSDYFSPEAEYLMALSYTKMCLYNDALSIIKQYYSNYLARTRELKNFIETKKDFSYLEIIQDEAKQTALHPYIKSLLTRMKKQMKFNVQLQHYLKAQNELVKLNKIKRNSPLWPEVRQNLSKDINYRADMLNQLIRNYFVSFINDVFTNSSRLFDLNLEIIAKQKDLIYQNQELTSDRARGDENQIKRDPLIHYYVFNGEFWADEIGDYSFGLKSNCEIAAPEAQESK
jgi:hypothetical protein